MRIGNADLSKLGWEAGNGRPLTGILGAVRQLESGNASVENQYSRVVSREGNLAAQQTVNRVFAIADRKWRGIGVIPGSGLKISEPYARYDAECAIPVVVEDLREHRGCLCGEILKGKVSPFDCPLFATTCTPEAPVGACMVSSEGTCAAAYKYGR